MVAFTFYLCHWKYHFWANLVEKIKIVSLSWNLVPRLTWTCRIQWWVLVLFSVLDQIFFLLQKIKIVSLSWNLVQRLIWIWRIQWWCLFFLFSIGSILFWRKFVPKNQNSLLKLEFKQVEFDDDFLFFFLDWKYLFWVNLV